MNPAMQNLLERRTIRKFKNTKVNPEDIKTILTAGIYAPSGMNKQPMRFMVIEGPSPTRDAMAQHLGSSRSYFEAAPALIVVLADKKQTVHTIKDAQTMGACIQNMLLAAHSLGLGTVWIGQNYDANAQFMPELGLSTADYDFHAVICLGYPEVVPQAPARQNLDFYMVK